MPASPRRKRESEASTCQRLTCGSFGKRDLTVKARAVGPRNIHARMSLRCLSGGADAASADSSAVETSFVRRKTPGKRPGGRFEEIYQELDDEIWIARFDMDPNSEADHVLDVNSDAAWDVLQDLGERFEVVWLFAAPPCGPGSGACVQYRQAQMRPGQDGSCTELDQHLWRRRALCGQSTSETVRAMGLSVSSRRRRGARVVAASPRLEHVRLYGCDIDA